MTAPRGLRHRALAIGAAIALLGCGAKPPPPHKTASPQPVARPAAVDAGAPAAAAASVLSRGGAWLCTWGKQAECQERCQKGNALSCARLGHLLYAGYYNWRTEERIEVNKPRAREAYARSCKLGYAVACNSLGLMLNDGKGGKVDKPKARALYRRACDAKVAVGCFNLAQHVDESDARRLFRRACDLGEWESCLEVTWSSNDRDQLRQFATGIKRAFRGAPVRSPRAAKWLQCPDNTIPVQTREGAGGLGGPEMFCATKANEREGPYIQWLSTEDLFEGPSHGVKRVEGSYRAGKRHGLFRERGDRGQLRSEGNYRNGVEEGEWKLFREDGTREAAGRYVAGKREGPWTLWDETVGSSRRQGSYRAGEKDGVWIEYQNGSKFRETHFVDGKQDGTETRTWPSGQKCVDRYRGGVQTGLSECWHPNGRKMRVARWRDGKREGAWREWHDNGKLEARGSYRDGKREGRWMFFHKNGRKREQGSYKNGKEVGRWRSWDERGRPEER